MALVAVLDLSLNKTKNKNMKKNIFRIAAYAVLGVCMTACSSGDDATSSEVTPQKTTGKQVTLVSTLYAGPTTRSTIAEDGVTRWTSGDKIAVIYQKEGGATTIATGTISTSGVDVSTFTATLDDPVDGCDVQLVYPATCVTSSSPYYNTSILNNQVGTLADIGSNRNIQTSDPTAGSTKLKVNGATAVLNNGTPIQLYNRVCIAKFTLKDGNDKSFLATDMTITDGTNTYVATPTAATDVFYVAMVPITATGVTITITGPTTYSSVTELTSSTSVTSSDYGKLLVRDLNDGNQAYLADASTSTNTYTKHTSSSTLVAGEFYKNDLTFGKTYQPVAVVAYVGNVANYCDKFIALALEDAIDTEITLSEAFGTYSYLVEGFPVAHGMKISGTDYARLEPWTEVATTRGLYDAVQANTYDGSYHATTDVASASRTDGVVKGWRIPSVTDFRLIFEQLKDNGATGSAVMSGITATNPAGIMDHNGVYGYDSDSGSGVTMVYPYGNQPGYYKAASSLRTYINKLCLNNDKLKSQFYWLSSQVKNTSGDLQDSKAWRFNFAYDHFMWNESSDKSLIRYVFAY